MFNDYIVYIENNIAESIWGNNESSWLHGSLISAHVIFFRPIHCFSTEKLICSLKNKSSNRNTTPIKKFKSICDVISACLTNIINRSLYTGLFPDNSKKARVTSIPKESDICNLSNYWPISVLPVFSKVFEKVMYKQLNDYLENNSILHEQ